MLRPAAVHLIELYQRFIRVYLPNTCRFVPSCSEYTKEAVLKYGFWKGAIKGAARLLRCHPFSGRSGDDPLE